MFAKSAEAYTSLNGFGELSYVNYKAKTDTSRFSGDTLAQRYSLTYTTSNLFYRDQPRYYDMKVGYDWLSFDTNTSTAAGSSQISDVFGKLHYNGSVGYNPIDLPIFFTAYATDNNPLYFKTTPGEITLMPNNLIYSIEGKYKNERYGATLSYDPDLARTATLRGLPRMNLSYDETFAKSLGGYYKMDYKIKNISVAGLSRGNNWLQFRSTDYEDNLDSGNNYSQKQFQIGLIDTRGNRLWSALTNWITVSADGQFTNRTSANGFEEYDLNFMAIASRSTWQARTFMNYNRNITNYDRITTDQETVARIPVYVNGLYGPEATWFTRVSFMRGQQQLHTLRMEDAYTNSVSVGGTAFTRSSFTLSPTLTVSTSKNYTDSFRRLDLLASLETNSTSRFSRTIGIAAGTSFNYVDNGYDTDVSQNWNQKFFLSANYRPDSKFSYSLREDLEIGEGPVSLYSLTSLTESQIAASAGNKKYLSSSTVASLSWNPSAAFSNNLDLTYDYRVAEAAPDWQQVIVGHRISYTKWDSTFRLDTRFTKVDIGGDSRWGLNNSGDVQYQPDRYVDALLRYTYIRQSDSIIAIGNAPAYTSEQLELLQRYNHHFYNRTGAIRRLATLTQEFTVSGEKYLGKKRYTYDFSLAGRYSPTERLSLYGSAKYENTDRGQETFFYTGGLGADFKLLSTTFEYAYAKRPSDNRIEKRLSASVRRTF